eukprot:COSAG02_NODE_1076_length_14725_cov_10.610215_6_plen_129_part_00
MERLTGAVSAIMAENIIQIREARPFVSVQDCSTSLHILLSLFVTRVGRSTGLSHQRGRCSAVARVKALGRAKTRDLASCNILFPPNDAAYLQGTDRDHKTADSTNPTDVAAPVRLDMTTVEEIAFAGA